MTWAKSYDAESYDEWDNKDDDKWGAQQWGKDRDMYGASSYNKAASEADIDNYGAYGKGHASASQGGSIGYGKTAGGYGGYGGYGAGYGAGYGGKASYGSAAAAGYGKSAGARMVDTGASAGRGAQQGAYDNDEWAKQAYGQDTDSRWGKSYDSVAAQSYDDEQYARKVRADDDQWAEDYDRYSVKDTMAKDVAASTEAQQPLIKKTAYVPTYNYGYGHGW